MNHLILFLFFSVSLVLSAQAQDRSEDFYREQVLRDLNPNGEESYEPLKSKAQPDPMDTGIENETPSDQYSDDSIVYDDNQEKRQVKFKRSQMIYATPVPQQKISRPLNIPKRKNWGLGLVFASGYSSNVAQFEGAPSGSFIDMAPNVHWFGEMSERIKFDLAGDLFYRTYYDKEVDELFRTFVANASGDVDFYLTKTMYLGLAGRSTHFSGREIDFTSPNAGQGRDSQLAVNAVTLSLTKDWSKSFGEIFTTAEFVRGPTRVFDEAGNQFFPDQDQGSAGLRVGAEIRSYLRWEGQYEFKNRQFLDRRARLSNGLVDPNFGAANTLREQEHSFLSTIFLFNVVFESGYDQIRDMENGALDRQSSYGNVSIPIELWNTLLFRPEAGIRFTKYDNFIDKIFFNPNADKKRDDLWTTYGTSLILDLGKVDPALTYRRTSLDSNFTIIEFAEDLVSLGLEAAF